MRRFLIFLPIFQSILCGQAIDTTALTGYESIKSFDIKKNLTVLASDSLEGRETSYPGQKRAANYIAGIFQKLGLKPIGDHGTYFQHFDIDYSRISPETNIVIETAGVKKKFFWNKDFISEGAKDTIISGTAAFVGFTDSEFDSTAQAQLRGRIVFVLIGKKDYVDDTTRGATLRRLFSMRHDVGSLATCMIPDDNGPASYSRAIPLLSRFDSEKGTMRLKSNRPDLHQPSLRFLISTSFADEVLRLSGRSLKELRDDAFRNKEFSPIFIDDVIITIHTKVIREIKQTENVLALLPGSDAQRTTPVIAFTAHYDHLGKSQNGVVFPGADDDGSGTAAVLELATAFVTNPIKPKYSLLFLTFTGEEKGLLGSQYYVDNPVISLAQTIADLHMDMIGRRDPSHQMHGDTNYLYVIGSDKISLELDSLLQAANRESEQLDLDYKYNDEQDPERYYYRSDHYNFAKNGVPAIFFFDGLNEDYHKPTDTVDKIEFERMSRICRMIYDLGWKLGNFRQTLRKLKTQE
jgi:hypothetical protein